MLRLSNSLWIAALAAGTAAAVATTSMRGQRAPSAPIEAAAPAAAPSAAHDSISDRADAGRIQGSPRATLWVREGSDFQCPYCKMWHDSTYAIMVKEFVNTGKIRFAFLNYPLPQHQNSQPAAEAAMCASTQGKFWPMHEQLFATQHEWEMMPNPIPVFDALAMKVGVNAAAWRSCMSTHATVALIAADRSRLRTVGANSTPTFFIGDDPVIAGVPTTRQFRDAINRALAKAAKP